MTQLEFAPPPAPVVPPSGEPVWFDVCPDAALPLDRGVCALVGGRAVAIFRCSPDGDLFALGNLDPHSGASVLSRGIVGSDGERPVVATPVFKQHFDLRTGEDVADPAVRVPTYPVRLAGDRIQVALPLDPSEGRR